MRHVLIALIHVYRAVLRPFLPPLCRFEPSCSHYAEDAVRRHGAVKGALLAAWRILRCNPFTPGGQVDEVPERGRWK